MGLLDQLNEVLLQTPRKYWGDKATRLGSLLSDSAATGAQAYGSANSPMAPEHANTLAGLLADFTPVVSDVKSAYDGMQSAREGDYLGAALGGIGALPLVPNLAGMFIGKGAKTWDAVNASRAMEMEQAGIDPRKIWSETGNWKGPDGHWRQEIPDNAVSVNLDPIRGTYSDAMPKPKMAAVIDHPQATSAYPDLNRIGMYRAIGNAGEYAPNRYTGGEIGINPNGFDAVTGLPIDPRSAAIHELQHAIQQGEGFALGGPGRNLAGEAEARATQARMNMDAAQRRNVFPADSYDVPLSSLLLGK